MCYLCILSVLLRQRYNVLPNKENTQCLVFAKNESPRGIAVEVRRMVVFQVCLYFHTFEPE